MPERGFFQGNAQLLGKAFAKLSQGQIRLFGDPVANESLHGGYAGNTVASLRKASGVTALFKTLLHQVDPGTAHLKSLGYINCSITTFQCPNHSISQILGIALHGTNPSQTPPKSLYSNQTCSNLPCVRINQKCSRDARFRVCRIFRLRGRAGFGCRVPARDVVLKTLRRDPESSYKYAAMLPGALSFQPKPYH